jgi:hypothetical protein
MHIPDYVRVGATAFPLWEDTHNFQSSVERAARTKLRIGHEHRCYSFTLSTTSIPALVFCVAQAFAKPCSWSHAYLVIPGVDEPLSRHFSFDPIQLNDYSLGSLPTPVEKIDTEFMLQLACDQSRRLLMSMLDLALSQMSPPSVLSKTEISLLSLSGDFPQLGRLVRICGKHYLLHRELLDIQALPLLRISEDFPVGL